jgi:hypothetical protein
MQTICGCVLGACALVAATVASAQAQTGPGVGQTIAPFQDQSVPANEPPRVPLFNIGNLPVQVWAPVEPWYDSHANRNLAAYPSWDTIFQPAQPPF